MSTKTTNTLIKILKNKENPFVELIRLTDEFNIDIQHYGIHHNKMFLHNKDLINLYALLLNLKGDMTHICHV